MDYMKTYEVIAKTSDGEIITITETNNKESAESVYAAVKTGCKKVRQYTLLEHEWQRTNTKPALAT